MMPPFLSRWLRKPPADDLAAWWAEREANLAKRKAMRPARSEAARRGHVTRRSRHA